MRVLSQVISASSCGNNWSAHWHIHTKIRHRLDPETTEKLVYVYSNSELVTSIAMLRSSRCLLGTMKIEFCTAGLLRQGGPWTGPG